MATDPSTIETSYINQFKAGYEQAFQQTRSALEPFVQSVRQASEFDFYDRVGVAEDMVENNTRYGDNPMTEIPHDRRRIGLRDFDIGKPIDNKDLVRVATDPTNEYTQALLASAQRKKDDIIIERIFGPAYTGKKGETVINFTGTNSGKVTVGPISQGVLTTAGVVQIGAANTEGIDIAKDYTGGAAADAGITLAKLRAARKTMMDLFSCTQDQVLDCFIGTYQFDQLLTINEIINSDYAVRKALAEGFGESAELLEKHGLDPALLAFSMWTETIRDAAKEGAGNTIFIDGNIATGDDAMRRLQAMTVSQKPDGVKKKSSTN